MHLRKGTMRTLTIAWALVQLLVSVGLLLVAPMLYEGTSLVGAVVVAQLVNAVVATAGIVLLLAKQWTALCWAMCVTMTYALLDLGWRIGIGVPASVIMAAAAIYGWQVLALVLGIKGRKAPLRTS